MKSYEEMADSVLCRIHKNEIKTKSRNKILTGAILSFVCLSLIIFAGVNTWKSFLTEDIGIVSEDHSSAEDVSIPKIQVTLSKQDGEFMDMIGFFIYQGNIYTSYSIISSQDITLVGDYLGTSTGLIDEWTDSDGYVELAGSVSCDFYSVNGYDPAFMLCSISKDNEIRLFINNNGITLNKGSEVLNDRFCINDNIEQVYYQTSNEWYSSSDVFHEISNNSMDEVNDFINTLNLSSFIYRDDIPLENEQTDIYSERELYHLFLVKNDGVIIDLRLLNGGYIIIDGFYSVCIKIDEAQLDTLINEFK